jgi:hypothetical protein
MPQLPIVATRPFLKVAVAVSGGFFLSAGDRRYATR